MNGRGIFILFFWIPLICQLAFTQEMSFKNERKEIPVTLHVDLNYAPFFPLNTYKKTYNGEFYFPEFVDSAVWVNEFENIKLSNSFSLFSFGIKLSVELDKKYRFGLNYKPIIVKNWSIPYAESSLIGSGSNTTFFLLSGFMGYSWHYFQSNNRKHDLQLFPYMGFGSYIGNNYFQGAGSRFLFNGGFEQSYLFKGKFGFDLGLEYNYWRYKNDYFSAPFNLQHHEKLSFNFLSLELGFKFLIGLKEGSRLYEHN